VRNQNLPFLNTVWVWRSPPDVTAVMALTFDSSFFSLQPTMKLETAFADQIALLLTPF
jgi:hypothetical protein